MQVRADVLQLRSATAGHGAGTEVTLPRYRAADGSWKAAVSLPEELKGSMGDVVLAAGIEQGILKQREMA